MSKKNEKNIDMNLELPTGSYTYVVSMVDFHAPIDPMIL